MLSDGLHHGVDRDDYDGIRAVNFSTLKWLSKSPAHYRHVLLTPAEDTDPKRLGRVVHIAAFEPERFRTVVAVWDGGARRGKGWDKFCAEHEGRELLTEHQYELCTAIQNAVRTDATAVKYLQNGRGEITLLAKRIAGLGQDAVEFKLKGRPDFDGIALTDLKSTKDASPAGFARQMFSLHYDAQCAWYSDLYFLVTGKRKESVIVAVENTPPHVVQTYRIPEHVLQMGRDKYGQWLDQLAFCTANSVWPGYFDGELELEPPAWMTGDSEEDISEEGLIVGAR